MTDRASADSILGSSLPRSPSAGMTVTFKSRSLAASSVAGSAAVSVAAPTKATAMRKREVAARHMVGPHKAGGCGRQEVATLAVCYPAARARPRTRREMTARLYLCECRRAMLILSRAPKLGVMLTRTLSKTFTFARAQREHE